MFNCLSNIELSFETTKQSSKYINATTLQKGIIPYKSALDAAVTYLIANRLVTQDADVVKALKMSKGTFSSYKNGKAEPSQNFVSSFEATYNIKLSDFKSAINGNIISTQTHTNMNHSDYSEKYIRSLEERIEEFKQIKEIMKTLKDQSVQLSEVKVLLEANKAKFATILRQLVKLRSKSEKVGEETIREEIRKSLISDYDDILGTGRN